MKTSFSIRSASVSFILVIAIVFFLLLGLSAHTYRGAIEKRENISHWHIAQLSKAQDLRYLYLNYEQEWKQILLRGHVPQNYHNHLGRFYSIERNVHAAIEELQLSLGSKERPKDVLRTFDQDFYKLGRIYRRALRAFNESIENPQGAADAVIDGSGVDLLGRESELVEALEVSRQESYRKITEEIKNFEFTIALMILLIVSALLVAVYYLTDRLVISPIKKGIQFAGNISSGDLSSKISIDHVPAEVADLVHSLESMQASIKHSQEELIESKEQAERYSQSKSEFLSRMSHELRTPLNAILGFGQLMQLEVQDENKKEDVDAIVNAGKHLLDLINEILDLSSVENNALKVLFEDVEINEVVEASLSMVKPIAQQKAITLTNCISEDSTYVVRGDYLRIKQVLINLLTNAIKYSPSQSAVRNIEGNELCLEIADNGPGILPDKQHLLFKPFERLDEALFVEGSGIGLALSKNLMELMKGEIGFDSKPGLGSTFWIRLPLVERDQDSYKAPKGPALDFVASPQSGEKQYTVLYVEDNYQNMRLMIRLIEDRPDIKLLTADNGRRGVEAAIASTPDLVLLDIKLPDMSGFEVLELLRKNELTRDIPVIAVSANAMGHDLEAGIEAGFLDYLIKPLNIRLFYQRLQKILPVIESDE